MIAVSGGSTGLQAREKPPRTMSRALTLARSELQPVPCNATHSWFSSVPASSLQPL